MDLKKDIELLNQGILPNSLNFTLAIHNKILFYIYHI